MKVVKVVNKNKKYTAKNGKEYTNANYYLVLDSGKYVAVRPAFGKDYSVLDAVCETIVNG